MQEIKKKFRNLFLKFFITVSMFILAGIVLLIAPWSNDIKMSAFLFLLILLLIITIWFRPRLHFHTRQLKYARLTEHPRPPFTAKHDLSSTSWVNFILKKEFSVFQDSNLFTMLHRLVIDKKNYATSKPLLEIIILIKEERMGFNHSLIDKSIAELQQDYQNRKIKVRNYTFIQLKYGETLTVEMKEKVDQVVFDELNGCHTTVVNIHYQTLSKTLYFLHNNRYAPSPFYTHAVELIKELAT